jgi:hypothetical protein
MKSTQRMNRFWAMLLALVSPIAVATPYPDAERFRPAIATPMLGEDGKPMASIFIDDMLHMNDGGYDIWREVVREVLIEPEVAYE